MDSFAECDCVQSSVLAALNQLSAILPTSPPSPPFQHNGH